MSEEPNTLMMVLKFSDLEIYMLYKHESGTAFIKIVRSKVEF